MNRDYLQQGEMAYLSGTKVGLSDSLGYYVDVFRNDNIVVSTDLICLKMVLWYGKVQNILLSIVMEIT